MTYLANNKLKNASGFSLLEVIVAMQVFIILSGFIAGTTSSYRSHLSFLTKKIRLIREIRVLHSFFARDFSMAFGFKSIESDRIELEMTPSTDEGQTQTISYFIQNNILYRNDTGVDGDVLVATGAEEISDTCNGLERTITVRFRSSDQVQEANFKVYGITTEDVTEDEPEEEPEE